MPYLAEVDLLPRYNALVEQRPTFAKVLYTSTTTNSLYCHEHMRLPEYVEQTSSHKDLPDFIADAGSWIVSQSFKDIFNELDKGPNEFLPIPVYRKDGKPARQNYYFLDIREKVNAIDFDQSKGAWSSAPDGRQIFSAGLDFDLALVGDAILGKHIWREATQLQWGRFLSDEVIARVQNLNLKKLRLYPLRIAVR